MKEFSGVPKEVLPITPASRFKWEDTIDVSIGHIPLFRSHIAVQNGTEKNLLFHTWGGLGDMICSEPTLRHVLKNFKGVDISLAADTPELFRHLVFKRVFDLREEVPNGLKYHIFKTIAPPDDSNLVWQFFSHMLTNCVDFPSLCAIRSQLPIADRIVELHPSDEDRATALDKIGGHPMPIVAIHPGKHWQSKTFPKDWWDDVISNLLYLGICPIIIGANTDDNRGTVDVDASKCLDLRNEMTVMQTVSLLQNVHVLLTNDSAPLHMAVTGKAHIGFFASCKHPDYITHWRRDASGNPAWGLRMTNLSLGGIWDTVSNCPNKDESVIIEEVDPKLLRSWLPTPYSVAIWVKRKFK